MKTMPLCYFAAIINLRISILLFLLNTLIINTQNLYAQTNPIAAYSGFQIITDGNFTVTGNAHIHGPVASGERLVISNTNTVTDINIDAVGSYIETSSPPTTVPAGLVIKKYISWPSSGNQIVRVMQGRMMYVHEDNNSDTSSSGGFTRIVPDGQGYNSTRRIEGSVTQNPPHVFQTVDFNFGAAFTKFKEESDELSECVNNVQLYNTSNIAIGGNNVTSPQAVKIITLTNGSNFLKLTSSSLANITEIIFESPNGIPIASKPLVITIALSSNFTWNNPVMTGVSGAMNASYILWNFYSSSSRNLTINGSNTIIGSILAPNMNLTKTILTTNDIYGIIIAKTVSIGTGEIYYYPFNSYISCDANCDCPDNALLNPSFENSTSNWIPTAPYNTFQAGTYAAQCEDNSGQQDGTSNSNLASFYQDVNVNGGSQVMLKFKGGTHIGSEIAKFGLIFFDNTTRLDSTLLEVDHILEPGPTMSDYTINATAPVSANKVRVIGKTGADWLKVDMICLSVVCTANGGTIAANQFLCSGGDPDAFSSTVDASITSGAMTLQWEKTIDSTNWTAISGTNSQIYDPSSITQTTWYRRKVSSSLGCFNYSNVLKVTVITKPIAGTDQTGVCGGSVATLTGTNPTTGTWSQQTENPSGVTLSSTSGGIATATFTSEANGTYYFIYTVNGCSDTMHVFLISSILPTPGTISGSLTPCPGTPGLVYSISSVPGATTYSWAVPGGWSISGGQGTTTITVTAGGCNQGGNISVTASNTCATSAPGTLSVNAQDMIAPTASNPANVTGLKCKADTGAINTEVVIDEADNCSTPIVSFYGSTSNGGAGTVLNPYVLTRVYRVTDVCGNATDLSHTLTVIDDVSPTASNPANITGIKCFADIPPVNPAVVINEADNCRIPTVSFLNSSNNSGSGCPGDPYVLTRTYRVTDANGNTTNVSHNITIIDDVAPTASNPASINFSCLADIPSPDPEVVNNEADNCSTESTVAFLNDVNNGGSGCPANPFIVTRTYRVTDACGNTNDVSQTITVIDNISPTASNPANSNGMHLSDTSAINTLVVIDEADNCSAPIVSFYGSSNNGGAGNTTDPYILTRTYRVTDACGNTTDVTHTIIITDNEAPVCNITSPGSITVYNLSDIITINASAFDNDGIITHVEFFVGGVKIGEDNAFPYSFDYGGLTPGYKTLTIKVIDNGGAICNSAPVVVYVNQPPSCGISSPSNGATLYDPAVLAINATAVEVDSGGIAKVEFYRNNIKIGEDLTFPYSFVIVNEPIGNPTLKIIAIDNFGATCESAPISLIVKCVRPDLNDDGTVNTSDLLLFLGFFGAPCPGCRVDFNDDGVINTSDHLLFLASYGVTCN